MRFRWLTVVIVVLAVGSASAAEDKPPFLYYYSNVLRGFVVERADGTDSRVLSQNLIAPDVHDVNLLGWSPSGQWLAWTENYKVLKVLSVDGLVARTLIDDPSHVFAMWSPVDDLLFVSQSPKHRVNDYDTGFALLDVNHQQIITQFDVLINGANSLSGPRWSPDGQFVGLYYQNYNDDPAVRRYESTFVLVSRDGKVTEEALSPITFRNDIGIGTVHWTPQGWLAHYSPDESKIILTNPDSGDHFEVDAPRRDSSSSSHRLFLWSPTGDYALYYDSLPRRDDVETPYELWLLSVREQSMKRISDQAYLRFAYYFDPFRLALANFIDADTSGSWSPDGEWAVFRITAEDGFALLDPVTGDSDVLALELPADSFGHYYFDVRWSPDGLSLEFDNGTADTPVQIYNLGTHQTSENHDFSVVRSVYSPSGRYLAVTGMAGSVIDILSGASYVLPVHSASVYNKTRFSWDRGENWLITEDYLCIAGDCPAILRYAVTNPQGSYWRELEDSEVNWLPDQVDESQLPVGAPESVLLPPETIDRDVEFRYGSQDETHRAGCDPDDPNALLIQERATDKVLYSLHNSQPCFGAGGGVYIVVSPDGTLLALGPRFADSYATLWDVKTGKLLTRFN
jgi:WD40 repeat protein